MSAAEPVALRPLSAADRSALETFSCRGWREPWADVVEEMIRGRPSDELALGDIHAIGAWRDDTLVGVAVWRILAARCTSILLAVANGHRRHGIARTLKQALIDSARARGATAVVSLVHWDNEVMLSLNRSFGANIERLPDDDDYSLCVIPLDRGRAHA